MKGLDLNELLDALEAGRSLLVWIGSWHASTGEEAVQLAWEAEASALAMRRLLGLVAEDDLLDTRPERLTADEIREVVSEPPSLVRLVRIARKVVQLQASTLKLHDFVQWGWWTAVSEMTGGEDPITYVWDNTEDPHKLAFLLQWTGQEAAYGQAVGLTLVDETQHYERWCHDTCLRIRELVDEAPTMEDLPQMPGDTDDDTALDLARFVRRLVAVG